MNPELRGLPVILTALLFLLQDTEAITDDSQPRFFQHQDIMADLHEGWESAGRFLGVDTSQGVASLVSASLAQAVPAAGDKQDDVHPQSGPSPSMFHGFFRMLGFDISKLNAIAVNAVVFIAKMIGSSLIKNFTGGNTGRALENEEVPEGSPLSWILEDVKDRARSLLSRAQDGELPEQVISALQATPADTDCIQQLVCRASPILTGMQRSLKVLLAPDSRVSTVSTSLPGDSWVALSPLERMYYFLPSRQDFLKVASSCEKRMPSCSQLFSAFDD